MDRVSIILCLLLQYITHSQGDVGLYNASDHVTILNGDNLLQTVTNSTTPWFVEYYSEWCGHCQDFAPSFKALAKDIAEWHRLMKVAVLNCADRSNQEICRQMSIESVPDMRVYPARANKTYPGLHYKGKQNIKDIRNFLIDYIMENIESIEWLYDNPKPVFEPATFKEVMSISSNTDVMYTAYVIEDAESYMGKSITLDVSSCTNLQVRRVVANTEDGVKIMEQLQLNPQDLPFLVVKSNNGTNFPINVKMKTRSFYTYQLTHLYGVGEPVISTVSVGTQVEHRNTIVDITLVDREKVYLADIESALRYSLTMEVASVKEISNRKLDALKKFLNMFNKIGSYLPGRQTTINFLTELNTWIQSKSKVTYQEWGERVSLKTNTSYLPTTSKLWVGCQSSKPSLRGYPCSLWTLFHTLTVAGYNANLQDQSLVPDTMYQYITNFFSCQECRLNFKKEIAKFPFNNAGHKYDAVLWLWKLHNCVNERLHKNSSTEDPLFPKIQFPSMKQCIDCYTISNEWNEKNVAKYLVHRYSKGNMAMNYLDTQGGGMQLDAKNNGDISEPQDNNGPTYNDFDADWSEKELVRFHPRALGSNLAQGRQGFFQGGLRVELGFTTMDFSLCLIVWVLSTIGAAFLCLGLKLRRAHLRRKLSKHIL
nr:sulfhydryl oxidase 1-like isoform X1 [Ciona intestinalis]|eukprot:XP_018670139.1 sulfhydryl oxidase 1-like isoform X1 [Ciona intestinalis]